MHIVRFWFGCWDEEEDLDDALIFKVHSFCVPFELIIVTCALVLLRFGGPMRSSSRFGCGVKDVLHRLHVRWSMFVLHWRRNVRFINSGVDSIT